MNSTQELLLPPSPMRTIQVPSPERELSIKDLISLLVRRRNLLFATVACFVGAAILVCVLSTRRYLATAEIQVQKESSSRLGLDDTSGGDSSYSDALQDNITIQTQADILQSDSLALKVIKDLKLANTDDFQPVFNPIGWALGLVAPKGLTDAQLGPAGAEDLGLTPRERMHVLGVFGKNLKVKPVAGTRLIDVSYLSSSPRLAAEVVNRLTQALSDYNFETRHNSTAKTAQYLTSQLADLRKQSEDLQSQVAKAQRESGIVSLGGVDAQGREQVYSAALDKLQQATTAYAQAQSNRIGKDAVYEAAKTGDPEAISTLSGGAGFGSSGDTALALIQNLRLQQATLKSKLAQASAKFGPSYPKLAEMQNELDTVDSSIRTEVARLAARAKNDAEVAHGVEASTRKIYQDLKAQADSFNDKTITYTIMRQEADQSRVLYETLFKQLKQAGVLADFKVSNISIVDPARVPARPAKPNVLLYLVGSTAAGLFFGCCGAFLRDMLDNKIRNLHDLETQLGQLPLGVLPYHNQQRALRKPVRPQINTASRGGAIQPVMKAQLVANESSRVVALNDPRSAYTEALRALRTSILLSRGGSPPQVMLITSSIAAEGKSMLSINLAMLLAQQNKKVLLVDCDFRRPTLHRTLNITSTEGLSAFLAGNTPNSDPLTVGLSSPDVAGLTVLPAGPIPPFPAELLGSEKMQRTLEVWREHYDFVIMDGAPVLPVTDSVVLSTMVDFTLLVARYEVTERQSLERSFHLLEAQTERTKIGIVLNAVRRDSSTYYQYYGYKDSVYYGGTKKYA